MTEIELNFIYGFTINKMSITIGNPPQDNYQAMRDEISVKVKQAYDSRQDIILYDQKAIIYTLWELNNIKPVSSMPDAMMVEKIDSVGNKSWLIKIPFEDWKIHSKSECSHSVVMRNGVFWCSKCRNQIFFRDIPQEEIPAYLDMLFFNRS